MFPILILLALLNYKVIGVFILLWLAKTGVELLLLYPVSNFFHKKRELIYFILLQFIHIPYIIYSGLKGQMGLYEWKERQVK